MRRHLMVFAVLFAPALAAAQESPEDVQRARQLFGEGVEQHEARRYDEAVDTFRSVLEIRSAPAVRYNLALNLFELGQYPEAQLQVELLLADPAAAADLQAAARELETGMTERGGQVRVETVLAADAHVEVDGYELADPHRPVRVLAGTHRITVVEGEEVVSEDVVSVGVGETKSSRPSAASSGTADGGIFATESAAPVAKDWRFWTALGVVAAIGVALVIVAIADDDAVGTGPGALVSW